MRNLPARGALAALALTAAIPAIFLATASLPWYAERPAVPPRVIASAAGAGPLRAGAAEARFELPPGVPIAGYARLSYRSEGVRDPVGARALVLEVPGCKVALVSAEILLVPQALEKAVREATGDLGLSGIVVAATHTHAGPGGFWDQTAGERLGAGPYDSRAFDAIAQGIIRAVWAADRALAPARVSVARGDARTLARSRRGGDSDARLTVVRVERPEGGGVAEIAVFAAHATILGKANRHISGDWPGRFLAGGEHGLRLFFEGALGDQSVEGAMSTTPEDYAAAFAARVDGLQAPPADAAPALGFARVELSLPPPDPAAAPALLRRAARNLAHDVFPATASVEAVRIGDLVLVATPAEPVAAVGVAWRERLPPGAELVSVANGYVGYVETPERLARGEGESVHSYFGPELEARLGEAARLAAERAMAPAAPAAPAPANEPMPAAATTRKARAAGR